MTMEHESVNVQGLKVSFGEEEILKDVSFSAQKGKITVLIGSSGCGKSTVFKHILGLHPIRQGKISIMGEDITLLSEQEQQALYLKIGVFYQNGALLNSLTVGENVALPLEQHSQLSEKLIQDIVYKKLTLVNLEDSLHQYPSELSGGMLKRAALARAIVMDPAILFCDEPGAGLDPLSLEMLDTLILQLKELLGMTIVMVTHEVSSIMRLADKIVLLEDGRVSFDGAPNEIHSVENQHLHDFFKKKGNLVSQSN